jgi:hypothetical protein
MGFIRNDDGCEFHGDECHSALRLVDHILETLLALAWLGVSYSGDASLHKLSCKLHAAASRKPTSLFQLTSSNVESQTAMAGSNAKPTILDRKRGEPAYESINSQGLKNP